MNQPNAAAIRKSKIQSMAENLGYTVVEKEEFMDISIKEETLFSYYAKLNVVFMHRSLYTKYLKSHNYLQYMAVCFKRNTTDSIRNRYLCIQRGMLHVVHDTIYQEDVETFVRPSESIDRARQLNKEWMSSIKTK